MQQPQLRAQDPLIDPFNEAGSPGPMLIVFAVFPHSFPKVCSGQMHVNAILSQALFRSPWWILVPWVSLLVFSTPYNLRVSLLHDVLHIQYLLPGVQSPALQWHAPKDPSVANPVVLSTSGCFPHATMLCVVPWLLSFSSTPVVKETWPLRYNQKQQIAMWSQGWANNGNCLYSTSGLKTMQWGVLM